MIQLFSILIGLKTWVTFLSVIWHFHWWVTFWFHTPMQSHFLLKMHSTFGSQTARFTLKVNFGEVVMQCGILWMKLLFDIRDVGKVLRAAVLLLQEQVASCNLLYALLAVQRWAYLACSVLWCTPANRFMSFRFTITMPLLVVEPNLFFFAGFLVSQGSCNTCINASRFEKQSGASQGSSKTLKGTGRSGLRILSEQLLVHMKMKFCSVFFYVFQTSWQISRRRACEAGGWFCD